MVSLPEARDRIKVPEGVTVSVEDNTHVTVKGPQGELKASFRNPRLEIVQDDKGVLIRCPLPRKREKALVGTVASHIRNMVHGVNKGFTYRMKTLFAHFPIKTKVEGNKFVVENFLGERSPRRATIVEGVKVEAKGEHITVTGIDLQRVSQTAANIERATKVRYRDIRVFQDGIYIVEKEA